MGGVRIRASGRPGQPARHYPQPMRYHPLPVRRHHHRHRRHRRHRAQWAARPRRRRPCRRARLVVEGGEAVSLSRIHWRGTARMRSRRVIRHQGKGPVARGACGGRATANYYSGNMFARAQCSECPRSPRAQCSE